MIERLGSTSDWQFGIVLTRGENIKSSNFKLLKKILYVFFFSSEIYFVLVCARLPVLTNNEIQEEKLVEMIFTVLLFVDFFSFFFFTTFFFFFSLFLHLMNKEGGEELKNETV